jgi:hypothetical protein
MLSRPDRARSRLRGTQARAAVWAALAAVLALPSPAVAARLIGGGEQASVARAFSSLAAHRNDLIVSIRASSVSPSWFVIKSARPESTGRVGAGALPLRLQTTYVHRVGGGIRPGIPPAAAKADLSRDFRVAVVYSGSGSEQMTYSQIYRSVCAGAGGFIDSESEAVSPMSWNVRFVVDLDSVKATLRSAAGATIVPAVTFDGGASRLDATEHLTRTYVDQGCFSRPTTFECTSRFHLSQPGADALLSFDPGLGTEIGIPMRAGKSGRCAPEDFTLGPSLWDSGASTALAPRLGLLGGTLPGDPYAPQHVSWPGNSALEQEGFLAGPCQGIPFTCTDTFRWQGTVRLAPVTSG